MAAEFAAVVLAAGESSRLGRPKQLLRWQQESLLERTVRLATSTGPVEVVVVLGCGAQALKPLVDVPCVVNSHWRDGLGSSLALAARQVPDQLGMLVLLCDQPLIDGADLQRLVAAWRQRPRLPAAAAADSYLGVPAIFPPCFLPQLKKLAGSGGARAILQQTQASRVTMPHALLDVDTEQDWQQLLAATGTTPP